MLDKLRVMLFNKSAEDKKPHVRDPGKCLVNIQLAGMTHRFYQDISFLDCLTKAMNTSTHGGGFLEFKNRKGNGYAINLGFINYLEICEDVYEISNDDIPGYSIYLQGKKDRVELGELSLEQVDVNLLDQSTRFFRFGNHYFKRDDVALICSQLKE
jgi:hypothetical protein